MTWQAAFCVCGDPHPHHHYGSNYSAGNVEHLDRWPPGYSEIDRIPRQLRESREGAR